MRLIGHLKNEAGAKTFGDYLTSIDVRNLVEPEADGTWALWVHDEEQIPAGQQALSQFEQNPTDPKYRDVGQKAAAIAEKEKVDLKAAQKRVVTADSLFSQGSFGALTITLIGISVLVTLTGFFTPIFPNEYSWLEMSEYARSAMLPEVRAGQVWRLITPIFVHFGILHLLFNMMWMRTLGGLIEFRQGIVKFAAMILILAITSNLTQFFMAGPGFGGMSGVVYGLFGFVWIRGRVDPAAGFFLPGSSVAIMMGWYVLCVLGVLGPIANWAHTGGLAVGAAWGALPLLMPRKR